MVLNFTSWNSCMYLRVQWQECILHVETGWITTVGKLLMLRTNSFGTVSYYLWHSILVFVPFISSLHYWHSPLFIILTFKKTKSRQWMRRQQKPSTASLFVNAMEQIWRSCIDVKAHLCPRRVLLFFQPYRLELTYQQYAFHWMMILCTNGPDGRLPLHFDYCRRAGQGNSSHWI